MGSIRLGDVGRLGGRDFSWYLLGQATSRFGTAFTTFAVPLVVYQITGSAVSLGLTMAASFLPHLLFGLVIGAVVDRLDRKRVMVLCDAARAIVLLVMAWLVTATGNVAVLYVGAFVLTTLGIAFNAGGFAAVPYLVPADHLVRANARLEFAYAFGALTGPTLAGVAVLVVVPQALLIIDAITYGTSVFSLLAIRQRFSDSASAMPSNERSATSLRTDVAEGLRLVWFNPLLRRIATLMLWVNFLDATLFAQLILLAKQQFRASDAQAAWLFGAAQVGILLAAALASRMRGQGRTGLRILGAQIGCGLATVALGITENYFFALFAWALYNGLSVWFNIHTSSLRQRIVPKRLLSRVMTVSSFLAWSAIPLGAVAGAAVAARVADIGLIYMGIGVLTTLAALAFSFGPLARAEGYQSAVESEGPSR